MNFNSSRGLSRRRYMQSAGLALLAPFLPASDSAGAASASVNNSSAADWGRDSGTPGATPRAGIVALALLVGLTVALAALPAAGPWLHSAGGHHD